MKTDVIRVDNQENGFREAEIQVQKAAVYRELSQKESIQLQLLAEEMLSMLHSITGQLMASFWVENEGKTFELHLTADTILDRDMRQLLIGSSSTRKNEAAGSFLGKLRDSFEEAMMSDTERTVYELPTEIQADITGRNYDDPEWDGYERSVLRRMATNVKIFIRGKEVHMTVTKAFE